MKKTFRLSDARPDPKGDARDEIAFHLEMRTREFVAQGLSEEAARKAALASFGDVTAIESEMRASRADRQLHRDRTEWWAGVVRDARVALRSFGRRPLYAVSVIAALGLGIAAAGSVFSVVNGVLLRPLPYARADRLAMVWLKAPPDRGADRWPFSAGFYDVVKTENRSFSGLAAFRSWSLTIGEGNDLEQVRGARVTPSLFPILGVTPQVGRVFRESEGVEGGPKVVILSDGLWRARFGADPQIIGKAIGVGSDRAEVVGVMPRGFGFPRGAELPRGLAFGTRSEFWIPLTWSGQERQNFGTQNLAVVGRLRDGTSRPAAQDNVLSIVREVLKRADFGMAIGVEVVDLKAQAAAPVERGLWLLLGAVVAVLLIACANVAGLLSARVSDRQREFAVRLALGARQPRVARQLVTETLVLAILGGGLGAVGTWWGTRLLLALAPTDLPRAADVGFGPAVATALLIVALLCGLAFGVIAIRGLRIANPAHALHGGGARTTAGRGAGLGRRVLVTAQVALSVLLLIGAGLLLQSFVRIQRVRPGFRADHALAAEVGLPITPPFNPAVYGAEWARFFEQVEARIGQLPGVTAVGAVSGLPLSGTIEGSSFVIVGREPARPEDAVPAAYSVVAGNYFTAAGIPVVSGRVFDSRDRADGAPVVVVSRALAAANFPSGPAVGQLLRLGFEMAEKAPPRMIIGVVDDVKFGALEDPPAPAIYLPENQYQYPGLTLVVRTVGSPAAMVPSVRGAVHEVNPTVALTDARTLASVLRASLARQRFTLTLIGAFAATALLLAVLGLYGVIAMTVQARRRELGVRLALGARPAELVRLVVGDGMRLVVVGAVVGLAGAWAAAGVLRALVFQVGVRDGAVYAAATGLVVVAALMATYFPARAAVRSSPTDALRLD